MPDWSHKSQRHRRAAQRVPDRQAWSHAYKMPSSSSIHACITTTTQMEATRSRPLAVLFVMLVLTLVVTIGASAPVSTAFSKREKWCDNCSITTRRGKAPRYSCKDYRSECYQGCRVCSCILSAEARCTCHDLKDYCDPAEDQQLRT